jgi:hypothetical protein
MDPTYTLIAAAITASVAAVVALTVAILSKEAKVSEFRQEWINKLRDEIAELVATMEMMRYALSARAMFAVEATDKDRLLHMQEKYGADFTKARALAHKIALRLRPGEADQLVHACRAITGSPWDGNDQMTFNLAQSILDAAKPVLKAEWERVKRGEEAFVALKAYALRVSQATLAVAVVAGLWWLIYRFLLMAEVA